MKYQAFTLIELLVVIAIIAILAAILFPVFAQAKLAAKKTVGLSNMKQIALGEQLYQADYDDHLVKSQIGVSSTPGCWASPTVLRTWRHTMQPYLKNTQLLQDSTNEFSSSSDNADPDIVINGATDSDTSILSTNFAANDAIIGFGDYQCYGDPYDNPSGLDDSSSIQYPASTIEFFPNNTVFQDGHWYWGSNNNDNNLFTYGAVAQSNGSQLMSTFLCIIPGGEYSGNTTHLCPGAGEGPLNNVGKVINFAWADGHAKAESYPASLSTNNATTDDWGASLYAIDTQNNPISQAERQFAAANLFSQYQ